MDPQAHRGQVGTINCCAEHWGYTPRIFSIGSVMENLDKSPTNEPTAEPSVWDWFVSLLRRKPIPIPEESQLPTDREPFGPIQEPPYLPDIDEDQESFITRIAAVLYLNLTTNKFRVPTAIFFALLAQFALEFKPANTIFPIIFYAWALILIGWATWAGDFRFDKSDRQHVSRDESGVRLYYLLFGAVFSLFTFFLTRGNSFNLLNLFTWSCALLFFLLAFWQGDSPLQRFKKILTELEGWKIHVGLWEFLVAGCVLTIIIFRISRLDEIPYDMWSVQAEKLLDVLDILEGNYSIFFPRFNGREGLEMYLAAGTAQMLGTGISFTTLKISMIFAGLSTLPFVYLFAQEYGGRFVGLGAMFLAGVAHWPNIISRLGLGFPLLPLFAAPALYFLVKALRRQSRNDFLLMGIAVGLGLHGYGPARIIPFAIIVGAALYFLHTRAGDVRIRVATWVMMSAVIGFVIFLPLFSAISEMPDVYFAWERTRVGTAEGPYPGSPIMILVDNLGDALLMLNWDNGDQWDVSMPDRPALDWVTGAFFLLGIVIVFVRYLRQREWMDLFILLLVPILMLPSILSLAFPAENPSPVRASGALVPVFTIAAVAFTSFYRWARGAWEGRRARNIAISVMALLASIILLENYNLTFNEYRTQHRLKTWNTREVGEYIKGFAASVGNYETAHIISTPHWLDGRLVAMIAGANPRIDYSIMPEALVELPVETLAQLFILKPDDELGLESLRATFPSGILSKIESEVEGHDFMIYFVPPVGEQGYPSTESEE